MYLQVNPLPHRQLLVCKRLRPLGSLKRQQSVALASSPSTWQSRYTDHSASETKGLTLPRPRGPRCPPPSPPGRCPPRRERSYRSRLPPASTASRWKRECPAAEAQGSHPHPPPLHSLITREASGLKIWPQAFQGQVIQMSIPQQRNGAALYQSDILKNSFPLFSCKFS